MRFDVALTFASADDERSKAHEAAAAAVAMMERKVILLLVLRQFPCNSYKKADESD